MPDYTLLWIVAICFAAALVLAACRSVSRCEEDYGNVLGAAAQHRGAYYACVRKCERSDPRQRLSQNAWACGLACDRLVTSALAGDRAAARRLRALEPGPPTCQADVRARCAEDCRYSSSKRCREDCAAVKGVGCARRRESN